VGDERGGDAGGGAPPGGPRRDDDDEFFQLATFWRVQALWPVTFCAVVGLAALGAGAVSMSITHHNPFARAALGIAALTTAFGLWDFRTRKGKLGGGAVLVAVLWVLSLVGGIALSRTGG
jgi:hypothetical protein